MQQLKVSEENSHTIGWKAVKNAAFNSSGQAGMEGRGVFGAGERQRNRGSAGGSGPGWENGVTIRPAGKGRRKREGKEEKTSVTSSAVTRKELSPPPGRQHLAEHCATDDHLLFSYRFSCWHWMASFFFFLSFGFITLWEKPSTNSK